MTTTRTKAALAAGMLAMATGPLAASMASAQNYPPPDYNAGPGYNNQGYNSQGYNGQDYNSQPYNGQQYNNNQPYDPNYPPPQQPRGYYDNRGYDQGPPPDLQAPPGYDGRDLPPPPPGYVAQGDPDRWRDADRRYAADAERWARDYCVKSHGNVGAGAVIGGIFGAILGNGLSGRHDRGVGTFAGAAVGAAGGAAIASGTGGNETSPGCPPGYVVRGGATYTYTAPGYYYAAPGWYRPWVFIDNNWVYRPYPYHDWYWRTYRGRGYGYHGGYRGGYRDRDRRHY